MNPCSTRRFAPSRSVFQNRTQSTFCIDTSGRWPTPCAASVHGLEVRHPTCQNRQPVHPFSLHTCVQCHTSSSPSIHSAHLATCAAGPSSTRYTIQRSGRPVAPRQGNAFAAALLPSWETWQKGWIVGVAKRGMLSNYDRSPSARSRTAYS